MLDLIVVMPVYNEEECIADVVEDWRALLASMELRFRILVLNDGSRDGTRAALERFDGDDTVRAIHKENSGHGPTIMAGYAIAVSEAEWVFQVDSDGEMPPEPFQELWALREECDGVFGVRAFREQNLGRRLISICSRLVVRVFYGGGVQDVNVPYRLLRSVVLGPLLAQIPADTFAPNVIIAGVMGKGKHRIRNVSVPHYGRTTGTVSIGGWKLWKKAALACGQTLRCAFTVDAG